MRFTAKTLLLLPMMFSVPAYSDDPGIGRDDKDIPDVDAPTTGSESSTLENLWNELRQIFSTEEE